MCAPGKSRPLLQARKRRWQRCVTGEALFGLPPTSFSQMSTVEAELAAMERLYSLYLAVVAQVKTLSETRWVDAIDQLDGMLEQVTAFQATAKKMPKTLRAFTAYHDCSRLIEQLAELLPLCKQLAHPSVKARHWQALKSVTGVEINTQPEVLVLGHLLAANLQAHRSVMVAVHVLVVDHTCVAMRVFASAVEFLVSCFACHVQVLSLQGRVGGALQCGGAGGRPGDQAPGPGGRVGRRNAHLCRVWHPRAGRAQGERHCRAHRAPGGVAGRWLGKQSCTVCRHTRNGWDHPSSCMHTSIIIHPYIHHQVLLASMATNRYAAPLREELTHWLGTLSTVDEQLELWLSVQVCVDPVLTTRYCRCHTT